MSSQEIKSYIYFYDPEKFSEEEFKKNIVSNKLNFFSDIIDLNFLLNRPDLYIYIFQEENQEFFYLGRISFNSKIHNIQDLKKRFRKIPETILTSYFDFYDKNEIKKRKNYPPLEDYFNLLEIKNSHKLYKLKSFSEIDLLFFKPNQNVIIYFEDDDFFISIEKEKIKVVVTKKFKCQNPGECADMYLCRSGDFNDIFFNLIDNFKIPFMIDRDVPIHIKN